MVVRGTNVGLNNTLDTRGRLRFTRDAGVWAEYLVEGLAFDAKATDQAAGAEELREDETEKHFVKIRHRHLFEHLPDHYKLGNAVAALDPGQEMRKSATQAEFDKSPQWQKECALKRQELAALQLSRGDIYWLSVPLDPPGEWTNTTQVDERSIPKYQRLAEQFEMQFPRPTNEDERPENVFLTPLNDGQRDWLELHQLTLGSFSLPFPDNQPAKARAKRTPLMGPQAFFDEGAQSDQPTGKGLQRVWRAVQKFTTTPEPVLKVTTEHQGQEHVSYQVILVVQRLTKQGIRFPATAIWKRLDEFPFPAEFTITGSRKDREATTAWIEETKRKLHYTKRELDPSTPAASGSSPALPDSDDGSRIAFTSQHYQKLSEGLKEFEKEFNDDETGLESNVVETITVAAATAGEATRRAKAIVSAFAKDGITVGHKIFAGLQADLWEETKPGTDPRGVIQGCQQIITTRHLAEQVPLLSNELGDPTGPIVGHIIANQRRIPYRYDPTNKASQDMSTGDIRVGDTRKGKTNSVMVDAYYNYVRSGVNVIHDPSGNIEWGDWGNAIGKPGETAIFDPFATEHETNETNETNETKWCADPIIVVGGEEGEREAQELLMGFAQEGVRSELGKLLPKVLNGDYRAKHDLRSLSRIVQYAKENDYLDSGESLLPLRELLDTWTSYDFTKCLFDDTLPPLPLRSIRILVFAVRGFKIPKDSVVNQPHLYELLGGREVFSRYMFRYQNFLTRFVCYRDRAERAIAIWDEFHLYGLDFAEGVTEAEALVRGGAKMNASIIVSTQAITDLPETFRELAPVLYIFHQSNGKAAAKSLQVMGVDKRDMRRYMRYIQSARPGMCLVRDNYGRIGPVQRHEASDPDARAAFRTTPPEAQAA
jgi:hypothetical protein